MRDFCPNCERITEQVFIECDDYLLFDDQTDLFYLKRDDHFLFDGQGVLFHLKYYVCLECGEDYEMPSAGYDPLAEAYLKLGLRTNDELIAIVNVLKIAMNVKEMRQWLNQADYG